MPDICIKPCCRTVKNIEWYCVDWDGITVIPTWINQYNNDRVVNCHTSKWKWRFAGSHEVCYPCRPYFCGRLRLVELSTSYDRGNTGSTAWIPRNRNNDNNPNTNIRAPEKPKIKARFGTIIGINPPRIF